MRSRPPTTGSGATTSAFWAWHAGTPGTAGTVTKPSSHARRHLELQSLLGLVPTLLALIGWALFALRSLRDRPRLAVALLPPLAIVGYLYFAVVYWTPDGDLLKATYMLTTAAGWAIGFGYALDRIRGRCGRSRSPCSALLALAELPFLIY